MLSGNASNVVSGPYSSGYISSMEASSLRPTYQSKPNDSNTTNPTSEYLVKTYYKILYLILEMSCIKMWDYKMK